jgi:hypothetical protein
MYHDMHDVLLDEKIENGELVKDSEWGEDKGG